MTESRNLIFLSQLKEHLGEDVNYTTNDKTYKLSIAATTELFQDIVSRSFFKQEYTELYDAKDCKEYIYTFYLKNWPVDSTADFSLKIKGFEGFTDELDPTLYSVDYEVGVVTINTPLYNQKNGIQITYTAGYPDSVDIGITENLLDLTQERALGRNIPTTLLTAALQQASLYSATMQASLCQDNKKNAFSSSKSTRDSFGLNSSAMFSLSKFKRTLIKIV